MINIRRPAACLILFFSVGACSFVPFAGGALEGETATPLADWRAVKDVSIIQLETRPDEPYSVKLWMIAERTHLYVYAGDSHAQWAQNIDENPAVRLKIADKIYKLHATRVVDESTFQQFASSWQAKYDSDRTDSTAANTFLYQLRAR